MNSMYSGKGGEREEGKIHTSSGGKTTFLSQKKSVVFLIHLVRNVFLKLTLNAKYCHALFRDVGKKHKSVPVTYDFFF